MKSALPCILTINGGSSSIRFAVYETGEKAGTALTVRLAGKIDRVGLTDTNLTVYDPAGKAHVPKSVPAGSHSKAVDFLLDWLSSQPAFTSVRAGGHRVVQGLKHSKPERITPKLLAELHRIMVYDPEH
ncbi:MAG: acetate/propionate family kinase, partial [Acidobacteriota bacterium]|nr:acetate/propionate family kinase [Acidobacteriota bacterium]